MRGTDPSDCRLEPGVVFLKEPSSPQRELLMRTRPALLAWLFCLMVAPATLPGQDSRSVAILKDIAKAKRAAKFGDEKALIAEMVNASGGECAARMTEFLAGRGTLDILFGASLRQLAAETQASANPQEALNALGRHWERAFLIEAVNKARNEAGRISTKEYFESVANRLAAEIIIAGKRQNDPFEFPPGQGIALTDPSLAKELAKAKRAALEEPLEQSKRKKLELLQWAFDSRFKNFLAGRGGLDTLLEVSRLWLGADLALATTQADRIAALERHWEATRMIEFVNEARYNASRIPIQDCQQSVAARLDPEIKLRQASGHGPALAWIGGNRIIRNLFDIQEPGQWPLLDQWMAREKFAAMRSDLNRLLEERRRSLKIQFEARFFEFLAGRGTLDIYLEAVDDLADAERAAGLPEAEVLKNQWQRDLAIKMVNDARYEAGRIPPQDKLQPAYAEGKARLGLVRLRAKTEH
jgi:hypothetical protein